MNSYWNHHIAHLEFHLGLLRVIHREILKINILKDIFRVIHREILSVALLEDHLEPLREIHIKILNVALKKLHLELFREILSVALLESHLVIHSGFHSDYTPYFLFS